MISAVVDSILGLSGGVAYLVVGALAFLEAAALVGLVVPGEMAVLLGGVLASRTQVSLPVMIAVASSAAVLGDSVGYEIGRKYGTRLLATRWLQRHDDAVARARRYVAERGGTAVFLGRWTGVLRALVPGLAGMARMPYGRFLVANVAGGVAWATAFTLLGYAAGASFRRVEAIAGQASMVLLGLLATAALLRWAAGRAIAHQQRVRGALARAADTAPVRWITGRFAAELRWLADRFDPTVSRGLALTTVVAALIVTGWTVGAVTQDVYGRDELALLDPVVRRWVADHSTPVTGSVSRAVLVVVTWPWLLAGVALAPAAVLAWRRDVAEAGRVLASGLGAWGIVLALQWLLPVPSSGTPFPSSPPAVVAGLGVAVTSVVGAQRGWAAGTRATAWAAMLTTVVATAALFTGTAALTDVTAGGALGAAWALSLLVVGPARPHRTDALPTSGVRAGGPTQPAGPP